MGKIREAARAVFDSSWTSRGLAVWLALLVVTAGLGGIVIVDPSSSPVGNATAAATFVDSWEDGEMSDWSQNTDPPEHEVVSDASAPDGSYVVEFTSGSDIGAKFSKTVTAASYSDYSYFTLLPTANPTDRVGRLELQGPGGRILEIKYGPSGALMYYDGASWVDTGISYSANTWYYAEFSLDYANNSWDLTFKKASDMSVVGTYSAGFLYANSQADYIEMAGRETAGTKFDRAAYGSPYVEKHTVSGTVTDDDGTAISGATVSDGNGNSTTTASDGSWSMDLPDDTYTLTASQSGYSSQSQTVTVSGSAVSNVNYSLVGQLRGYVRDGENDNNPLEGATVETSGGSSDSTNATGFWSLPLTDGTYTVTADHPDYTAFQDDISVSGATSYNYTLCQSGCTSSGNKTGELYTQEFILNDSTGKFEGNNPQLRIYTYNGGDLATEGVSTSDWLLAHSVGFNHDQRAYADITDGELYKLEVRSDAGQWDMIGYRADVSSGPTELTIGTTKLTESGGSSGGSSGGGSSSWTPYPDGSTHTATPADGYGPTVVGDCRLEGEDGIRIEYYDPSGETYSLDYSLTDDSGELYEGTKDFSDGPVGYYWGCVLDTVTQNASDGQTDVNWTARDENGTVLSSGSGSVSPPMFGPSGDAPSSTGERVLLLVAVVALLAALWYGGRKYLPGDDLDWWPAPGVSPAFAFGAPVVLLVALDMSGGGTISASLSWAVARVAPLAMIVGGGLAAYYIWNWIQPGPME